MLRRTRGHSRFESPYTGQRQRASDGDSIGWWLMRIDDTLPAFRPDPRRDAERQRLRGLLEDRWHLERAADLPELRPRRLLRRFEASTRNRALSANRPSS